MIMNLCDELRVIMMRDASGCDQRLPRLGDIIGCVIDHEFPPSVISTPSGTRMEPRLRTRTASARECNRLARDGTAALHKPSDNLASFLWAIFIASTSTRASGVSSPEQSSLISRNRLLKPAKRQRLGRFDFPRNLPPHAYQALNSPRDQGLLLCMPGGLTHGLGLSQPPSTINEDGWPDS